MLHIFFKPVFYERLWLKDKISKRQNTELAHSAPNVTPTPSPGEIKKIRYPGKLFYWLKLNCKNIIYVPRLLIYVARKIINVARKIINVAR